METELETPRPLEHPGSRTPAVAFLVGAVVVVAVAVAAGAGITDGERAAVVIPIAGAVGSGLAVVAFTRFELFLLLVIATRASLDAAKLTSASSVDATGALSVLFIVAAAVWLYRERHTWRDVAPFRGSLLAFSAFFVAGALSVASSTHPLESAVEAVRIGTVVVVVIALSRAVRDDRSLRLILGATIASAIIPLAAGAVEVVRGQAGVTAAGISRVDGTFLHPNPFAAYLFLILVLAVSLFPHVSTRWRWLLGALVPACGVVLVGTYARGAWIAALIGLTIVAMLQSRRAFFAIVVAVAVVFLAVPSVGFRLADLGEERRPSGAAANSLAWRVEYWGQALELQDDPLFGIGLREVELTNEVAKAPHNDFVRVYVETGLLGLAAYVWLLVALFVQAVRTYRRAAPGLARGLAIAFLATLSGLAVLSITSNLVSQLVILWYFAAIMVLATAASFLPAREEPAGG